MINRLSISVIALALVSFIQVLDTTIINVSLVSIAGDLGISSDESTWVVTSFNISLAVGLPLVIWLSKKYGQLFVLQCSLLLFSFISFLCCFPANIFMLVITRFFHGFAASALYPLTQSLLYVLYTGKERGKASGILSMVTLIAPVLGPLLGGWLTENFSWRWVFIINIPFCLIAYTLLDIFYPKSMNVKNTKNKKVPFNFISFMFLSCAVVSLQIFLDTGNQKEWFASKYVLLFFMACLLSLLLFCISVYMKSKKPYVINFNLFKTYSYFLGIVLFVLAFGIFFVSSVVTAIWLRRVLEYTPIQCGIAIVPSGIAPIVLSVILGKYLHLINIKLALLVSYIILGISCFLRSQFSLDVSLENIMFVQFVLGLSSAPFFLCSMKLIFTSVGKEDISEASMQATFFRLIGSGFFTSISTYVWNYRTFIHTSYLSENILGSYNNSAFIEAVGQGNHKLGIFIVNQLVNKQATQMGFNDVFTLFGWSMMILSLFMFFWYIFSVINKLKV